MDDGDAKSHRVFHARVGFNLLRELFQHIFVFRGDVPEITFVVVVKSIGEQLQRTLLRVFSSRRENNRRFFVLAVRLDRSIRRSRHRLYARFVIDDVEPAHEQTQRRWTRGRGEIKLSLGVYTEPFR